MVLDKLARETLRSSLTLAKKLYDIPTQVWVLSDLTGIGYALFIIAYCEFTCFQVVLNYKIFVSFTIEYVGLSELCLESMVKLSFHIPLSPYIYLSMKLLILHHWFSLFLVSYFSLANPLFSLGMYQQLSESPVSNKGTRA